jgi:hypothetical protein
VRVLRHYSRRLESWAHVAGLAATAWLVLPHGGPDFGMRLLQGWIVASLALGWAILLVFLLRMVIRHMSGIDVLPTNFRHAGAAVWFAPAILLPPNPAGITAAVVLAIGATRLLCSASATADWSYAADIRVLGAGELSMDALPRHLAPALAVSAGLQGAVCLLLLDHPASAMALLSVSVATLTCIAIALGAWGGSRPPNLPRSVMGLCLTFLLAMMAGHFMGGGGFGYGRGTGTTAFFGLPRTHNPNQDAAAKIGPDAPKPEEPVLTPPPGATGELLPEVRVAGADAPGSFPGVILWPEVKPEVALVEPYPAHGGSGPPALVRPFVIPFGGEYWMYRWPFARPPRSSFFRRGTPAKLAFSTTDRAPLEMEALQKLDRSIRLTCCSKIEVSVQNADRAAAGIRLELVVIDNQPPYKSPLSLGVQPLRGIPAPGTPMLETLDFVVPTAPRLAEFDELKVIFHRDPQHQDRSAKVAIDRFTLLP